MVGLMQSLAMELGPHGIRVNAILPGAADDVAAFKALLQAQRKKDLAGA